MRVVLELRPRGLNREETDLWVLKSNFLQQAHKQKSYVLKYKDGSVFENTQKRTGKIAGAKINNTKIIDKVLELREENKEKKKSARKIEEELKDSDLEVSKSTIHSILSKHEK